jgi:hypothetical protein
MDRGEIMPPLLDRMGEIMHLGVVRLLVQVFQQNQRAMPLGAADDPLQPFEPDGHPTLLVWAEVEAGMHDDPFGAHPRCHLDIGFEIPLDRVADKGRIFGDVDRRRGVQHEMHAVPLAGPTRPGGAGPVDARQLGVELNVDPAHPMRGSPFDRVLDL